MTQCFVKKNSLDPIFISWLLQGLHHIWRLPLWWVYPRLDAQIDGHQTRKPQPPVDVARHHIAGPVRSQVDARGANAGDQEGAEGDQNITAFS